MYHSKALESIKSPVTDGELNAWVRGVDECDPVLSVCLIAATGAVIKYIELELLTRARVTTWNKWPTTGTETNGISKSEQHLETLIELPYSNLVDVEAVTVYGEVTTDYTVYPSQQPALIDLSDVSYIDGNEDDDAIAIQYLAGYGGANDVPEDIKTAILTAAGYMFDHRGSCDMSKLLDVSGAKDILQSYKVNVVII